MDRVEQITVAEHLAPLPRPLELGTMRITQRHYTSVRLVCESGTEGVAYAQTRGGPVAQVIRRLLEPVVLGQDGDDVGGAWDAMYRATIALGRGGLVMRGMSLLDIALWDARGRRAGARVCDLLANATARGSVPVIYVAGYPRDRDGVGDVVGAAVAAARRGHATIKIARTPSRPAVTAELLRLLDAELPGQTRLCVDINWGWATVEDALTEIDAWPSERLAWVEDPFAPEEAVMLSELRQRSPAPIAAGDDLTDRIHARRLLEHAAVDVLRLDVAAIGGLTGAQPLLGAATAANVPVSFHISPEASIHLAAASKICGDVETFDRNGNPLDPSHELVAGGPVFENGQARLPAAAGLGFDVEPPAAWAE